MWKRAQKDEGSRVTGEDRQWIQLLEALEEFCKRGLNEGSVFREVVTACCMQRKRELSGGPEGHYI